MLLENKERDRASRLLQKMCQGEEMVSIITRDRSGVKVDKNLLLLFSPLLNSALSNVGCCKTVAVSLPEVSSWSVRLVLEVLQTGSSSATTHLDREDMEEVVEVARDLRLQDMEKLLASEVKREDEYSELTVKEEIAAVEDGEIYISDKRTRDPGEEVMESKRQRRREDSWDRGSEGSRGRYSSTQNSARYPSPGGSSARYPSPSGSSARYPSPSRSSARYPSPTPTSQFYPSPQMVTIPGSTTGSPVSMVPVQYATPGPPYYQQGPGGHPPPQYGQGPQSYPDGGPPMVQTVPCTGPCCPQPSPQQMGVPGGPQMGVPGGPQIGGPQMGGPGGPQMMGGPGGPQMGGPGGPQMVGTGGPQMGGPGGPQMGGPGGPQMGGPGGPQMGGPGGPQSRPIYPAGKKKTLSWNQMSLEQKLEITCPDWNKGTCVQRDDDYCYLSSGIKGRHACNQIVDYGGHKRLCWGKHARKHHFKNTGNFKNK